MNSQVRRYYRKFTQEEIPLHLFHDVISLHETDEASWAKIKQIETDLPQGWWELSRLVAHDRIEEGAAE